jgi:predicted O-methyltransferase YrrM
MTPEELTRVDRYFEDLFVGDDAVVDAAIEASRAAGLPPHQVSKSQAKLLFVLARMVRAERILEIGTLGGVSAIFLGRAVAPGGRVITLELNPTHVRMARENLTRAGLSDRVEVREGAALETLETLGGPFDLAFIDADKPNNPAYFQAALKLVRTGGVIVVDNVVRRGAILSGESEDANVIGTRRVLEMVAAEPRVSATAIQTVGDKGWDGFLIAHVSGDG